MKNVLKFFVTIGMLAFLGALGASRVFRGAHTINEVLFGFLIGGTIAIILHFKVKQYFLQLPQLLATSENGTERYSVPRSLTLWTIFYTLIVPVCIAMVTLYCT